MKQKTEAHGSFLGYLYQSYYALSLILERDNDNEIAIEKFDDVVLIEDGKIVNAVQVKHHLDDSETLTISSIDLWRTMANWCESYSSGNLRPNETMLTLITTRKVSSTSVLSRLLSDNNRDPSKVRNELDQISSTEKKSFQKFYDAYNTLDDFQKFSILDNVYIISSHPKIDEIKKNILKLIQNAVTPSKENDLYDDLVGWWWKKVIEHLLGKSTENISKTEIRSKILDLARRYRDDNLPLYFSEQDIQDKDLPDDERQFVEQLRWISLGELSIRHSKSDYYLASEHRSRWMRENLIFIDEIQNFDFTLYSEWKRKFDEILDEIDKKTIEKTKKNRGKNLLKWANDGTERLCIRPMCTAPFIRRGSFHILADRDESLKVGWHPDFEKKIKQWRLKNA
jgi:hypothetical protein